MIVDVIDMIDYITNWQPLSEKEIESITGIATVTGTGCETCSGEIGSLAATCPTSNKNVGDIVRMNARPMGGTAPYTVSFKKGTTLLKQFSGVSEGQTVTYDYTTLSTDAGLTQVFSDNTIDSCSAGAKSCNEQCSITVNAISTTTCKDIMCALITGSGAYYQVYKYWIQREPDCYDAQWLCDQGIDTEAKLIAFLASTITCGIPTCNLVMV